jgi:glycosyltransferase involved in cell wall biosynthesis
MAPCFGTIARIIRKNKHTQLICIADNIIPHERHFWDNWLTRYFIGGVDAFVLMSNTVLQDLAQFDRKKLRAVNPHPLFDNFGEAVSKAEACTFLKLDPEKKYILFFGFIRDYKGLDVLIEAFNQTHADCDLIIAGEFYADRTAYDDQIAKSPKRNNIHRFHNFIPDGAVKYFFCAADAVVQPYKHATQSGVTQVCYHFNKPMLVTNVGGLPEIVPDNKVGFVVEPDEQAVADAILKFYGEHKETEFIQNILEEKQKYSWKVMVEKVKGFL